MRRSCCVETILVAAKTVRDFREKSDRCSSYFILVSHPALATADHDLIVARFLDPGEGADQGNRFGAILSASLARKVDPMIPASEPLKFIEQ
jgi:hypothetical protein